MRFPSILVLASSLFLAACGGEGTGDVGGVIEDPVVIIAPVRLTGAEFYSVGAWTRGNTFSTLSGPTVASSATDFVIDGFSNTMGTVNVNPINATYALDDTNGIAVDALGRPSGVGGFDKLGAYGVYASDDSLKGQQFHIMTRRGALTSTNQLVGTWHVAWLGNGAANAFGASGRAVLGLNDVELQDVKVNNEIAIETPGNALYDHIVSDGKYVFDSANSGVIGSLSANGDVLIASGGSRPGTTPILFVFVRRAIDATNALLAGEYWITWMSYDGGWSTYTGTATLDGNGAGSIAATYTNGITSGTKNVDFSYHVSATGKLSISTTEVSPTVLEGGVTQNGRFAVGGGSISTTAGPTLMTLVRK